MFHAPIRASCLGRSLVRILWVTDTTRTLLLQYVHPPVYRNIPASVFPVGVRIQGFVDSVNLRPLGNWSRGSTPSTALQHITLSGAGRYDAEFAQYVSAVSNIIKFIYRSLNSPLPEEHSFPKHSLFFARRVFTKITAKNRDKVSKLKPEDDPMMETRSIGENWRVTEKTPRAGGNFPVQVHLKIEHVLLLVEAQRVDPSDQRDPDVVVHGPGLIFGSI
ncbi:hypothetical protein R3P38DRAFT_2775081 [Favolaschia claudopus]|uniref:Uncharacterized protein n=1 Tax=Favolaschia claudopus TaxID=2862362 RepID=A0AAW0BVB6_9AGAR